MSFFSVIVPTFNRASLIEATLGSILKQEFSDFEIIVVDDGSTDNTLELLKSYGSPVRVLQQKNKGPGEARNLGIRHALGQYIVFLDSDDLWFPWTLATYKQVIEEYCFPSFIAGRAMSFQSESELAAAQPQPLKSQCFPDYYATADLDLPFITSTVAIRRAVLQEVGGFTSQWINSEDNDLWLKLGVAEKFVYVDGPILLGYRQHDQSAVANFSKTYQGTSYLIQQEQEGHYPGGKERQRDRWKILTRHIRPVSLACLREGDLKKGWKLYKKTLSWHLSLSRIRYLFGFLLIMTLKLRNLRMHS